MTLTTLLRSTALITLTTWPLAAHAADTPKPDTPKPDAPKTDIASLLPADSITKHSWTTAGHNLTYTAHAGTLTLRDDKGAPAAKIFYTAYTVDGANPATRPVSFFFNGGPGAGSAFLELGAAGPDVLQMPKDSPMDGARATLTSNPDSWLPATDMVFIDAVGTGYSRALDESKAAARYYGVKPDATSFAKAIELWVGANGRQPSPHYIVGESYGGIRSIETAYALQTQQNLIVNGIVMISPAIEMQLLDTTNDPFTAALLLPSLIASNLETQHKLSPQAVDDAYHYALGPYLTTLANTPPQGDAAKQFYQDVATRTGLPEPIVARENGAPNVGAHDIRSRNGRLYSLYDGTQSVADPYPDGEDNSDSPDPTLFGYGRAYGNAFEGYAANTLHYRTELTYDLLNLGVNAAWDYGKQGGTHQIALLRKLLALDPSLHVFIANGYFDLACPFGTTRWMKDHIPVGAGRIGLHLYPGGHMLYARPDSRAALTQDITQFYRGDLQ